MNGAPAEESQRRIPNAHGELLACTYVAARPDSDALVVIGHGLTSDRERPWSRALSEELARVGVSSVRIAFSGNGDSEGSFEDSCITKEVEDLGAVLDAFEGRRRVYVGHSMGGAVGLLRAARDPRIEALVSLAAIAHPREFSERLFGDLRPGDAMLGKPACPWSTALAADFLRWEDLARTAPVVRAPWLLVHGTADEVVPSRHSEDVARLAPEADFVRLEGVDHSFTGAGLAELTAAVVPWIARTLGSTAPGL